MGLKDGTNSVLPPQPAHQDRYGRGSQDAFLQEPSLILNTT